MGMFETVVYREDSSSSDPLRSITEATTDFMDWLSGSSKENHDDDPAFHTSSSSRRRNTTTAIRETNRRTKVSAARSSSYISSTRASSSSPSQQRRPVSSSLQSKSSSPPPKSTPRSSIELLKFTKDEVESIVESPMTFRELQKALRNNGCVTNTYLKENMHHYMYHLKQLQASQRRQSRRQQHQQQPRRRRHTTKEQLYNDMPTATPMMNHQIHPNQPSSIAA